jgi:SAM-dependent methyltransferase
VSAIESLSNAVEELRSWLHNSEGNAEELAKRSQEFERQLQPISSFVAASRATPDPAAIGLERFEIDGVGTVIGYQNGPRAVDPRNAYLAFEDVFRLSEDVIRERQRPYLSLLGSRRPVLDVGCGRGEFLELLREAGIPATGVDLDPGMVEHARAKGLSVEHDDGITHLEALDDGSLGAIFAAQVVEHLSYDRLLAFLRLSVRKLAPGGLLIAETVNPHSPGALKNFWVDLTHRHPVFPEVLLTLCRGMGYGSAYIFHPGGSAEFDRDREWSGDYALIAERRSET